MLITIIHARKRFPVVLQGLDADLPSASDLDETNALALAIVPEGTFYLNIHCEMLHKFILTALKK